MKGLIKYDTMVRAIDLCHRIDEVQGLRSQAAALKEYARIAGNREAEQKAAAIRVRAERKAGELSAALEKSKGGRPKTRPDAGQVSTKEDQLRAVGISRQQASEWERLADIPEADFEAALDQAEMPSAGGIITAAQAQKHKPVSHQAIDIWDWLRTFEIKFKDLDPTNALLTMTPEMLASVHAARLRAIAWLGRMETIDVDVASSAEEEPERETTPIDRTL